MSRDRRAQMPFSLIAVVLIIVSSLSAALIADLRDGSQEVGLTVEEIERMKREARDNESRDKEQRERVDKLNAADSLIFQTEKQLKEFGDKLPADKKGPIEQALAKLKDAHKSQDLAAVETATAELSAVWQAASEELYKQQGPQGQPGDAQTADAGQQSGAGQQQGGKNDGEVTDVDFEEVK